MEAGKHNVKQLFQKDIRYVIPTFQRPYVWRQSTQWEPLWDDVRNIAETYVEESKRSDNNPAKAEKETGTHFLGAIVLQQIPTPTSDIERRDVIDGQQRMTTLQILLDAAQEVIESSSYIRDAKRLSKLVLNDEDFAVGDDIFKLWPTSGDQDAFRSAMTNGPTAPEFAESLVVQAHEFFSLQIDEWLKQVDEEERQNRVQALVTTLMGLLELVVIDLKTGDDAYVIFETLNARGTPLLASDLVKNFVLQTAHSNSINADEIYEKYWITFEEDWWRQEIRRGRIVAPRIDVFLNYWLIARQEDEVPSHKIFPMFRNYVQDSDEDILEIVQDIQNIGATYKQLDKFNPTSPEGTFLYRWETVQAGVVTPLLLLLFAAKEQQLSKGRKIRCLNILENYLIRRMLCRMTTKDYNRLFLELISQVKGNMATADDIIFQFFDEQTAESREWPSDERLLNSLLDLPLYRLLTRARLRMVLEAIEETLRTEKAEDRHVTRGRLTIEHILPQTWQEYWPIELVDDPEEYHQKVGQRDRMKHTLGNLTLVNNKLNPSLSNAPWGKKQQGFQDHSVLFMNKQLLSKWGNKQFAEPEIIERGKELAEVVYEIWPRTL